MRFIHFADCHLDGFRDYKLSQLGFYAFKQVIKAALEQQVDFVLLAGDLFNTALPRVEALKVATEELKKLADANIPVYAIAGSHDYSAQGKTILDVLELAGLLTNVMKEHTNKEGKLVLEFTEDKKTGALITGLYGKRGMLDKAYYKKLETSNLAKEGFKIFLFHTALEELKTKELEHMPGQSINLLPPYFDYYAGGHVHITHRYSDERYQHVVYPGPTFPNSFSELEQLKKGSYVVYDDTKEPSYQHVFIEPKKVISFTVDAQEKTPQEVHEYIESLMEKIPDQAIVLLRLTGCLSEGSPKDIELENLIQLLYQAGAYTVLTNTAKLTSKLFSEQEVQLHGDVQEIEQETIGQHLGQLPLPKQFDEQTIISRLRTALEIEQEDGETKTTYTERVLLAAREILEP